jgi:hypothetical protein
MTNIEPHSPIALAFRAGYIHACRDGRELAPGEIQERFPGYTAAQVDAFGQGLKDGFTGDSFRFRTV